MTEQEINKALYDLRFGQGGGNTTQICIEALEFCLDYLRGIENCTYPLMAYAAKTLDNISKGD